MSIKQHQSPNCSSHSCSCHSHSTDSEKDCSHAHDPLTFTKGEIAVLQDLVRNSYLPVSRFVMSSSKEKEARFASLAPVYINAIDDSLEKVKEIGGVLSGLEKKRLISLDYDIPLQNYDYTLHTNSVLFAYFTETVNEGKKKPSFLCDTAEIELGSIALTELGEKVWAQIRHEYDSADKANL
ncbi:hypothetical protein [Desulfosporosinus meridiei]|uniref:Uncharacterized protein n=1 Tax=Desulfosporosinus meridiei (strain ATCC BAA-275 / DSM 13257 / KCTC 12902 / NCIMB 13706 / S10) TaxID=768704 RepID=J7IWH8_DESMD|nr:hypothetical protein [Desulfosporosinus meridiei]AFQ43463.1 hypothetical protein Desmer_1470 [Desulfosporosinus meridiei DSM 13257]